MEEDDGFDVLLFELMLEVVLMMCDMLWCVWVVFDDLLVCSCVVFEMVWLCEEMLQIVVCVLNVLQMFVYFMVCDVECYCVECFDVCYCGVVCLVFLGGCVWWW